MSQIFKTPVSINLLTSVISANCPKHGNYYIFNNDAYKKGIFNNTLQEFIEKCKEHYHLSKHKYLDKKLSYKMFTTILRQVCNCNAIQYTSQIKYDKSQYSIYYYLYI